MTAPRTLTSEHTLYVSRFASWAPSLAGKDQWLEWATGNRQIGLSGEGPGLDFPEPRWQGLTPGEVKMFKRRLSQVSKMTVQVVHELLPVREDTGMVFLSFRGEIARQYKINRMLIEEGDISPAAFSLSVFNTPAAAASIAFNLTAGYSAIYPAGDRFADGFLIGAAPVLCGDREEILLVYADERCPPEYGGLCPLNHEPLAFGIILTGKQEETSIPVPLIPETLPALESPREFLKYLYCYGRAVS